MTKIKVMEPDQSLTSDQIKRYSRAFHKYDTDRDGNINGKDLGKILRHIGHNPTEAEIQVSINGVLVCSGQHSY